MGVLGKCANYLKGSMGLGGIKEGCNVHRYLGQGKLLAEK